MKQCKSTAEGEVWSGPGPASGGLPVGPGHPRVTFREAFRFLRARKAFSETVLFHQMNFKRGRGRITVHTYGSRNGDLLPVALRLTMAHKSKTRLDHTVRVFVLKWHRGSSSVVSVTPHLNGLLFPGNLSPRVPRRPVHRQFNAGRKRKLSTESSLASVFSRKSITVNY